jgi:hypothetical protein
MARISDLVLGVSRAMVRYGWYGVGIRRGLWLYRRFVYCKDGSAGATFGVYVVYIGIVD